MTTKQRFRNKYRLQIREKDHEPMPVHLVDGEVNATFDLVRLEVVSGSVPRDLFREVKNWLIANQSELIEEWKAWQR
jgi:hypothetical protein